MKWEEKLETPCGWAAVNCSLCCGSRNLCNRLTMSHAQNITQRLRGKSPINCRNSRLFPRLRHVTCKSKSNVKVIAGLLSILKHIFSTRSTASERAVLWGAALRRRWKWNAPRPLFINYRRAEFKYKPSLSEKFNLNYNSDVIRRRLKCVAKAFCIAQIA